MLAVFGVLIFLLAGHALISGKISNGLVVGGFGAIICGIAWLASAWQARRKSAAMGVAAAGALTMCVGLLIDHKSGQAVEAVGIAAVFGALALWFWWR